MKEKSIHEKLTVEALEAYLSEHYCGRAQEQSLFMKLVEEVGETAEVLNKKAAVKYHHERDLEAFLSEREKT